MQILSISKLLKRQEAPEVPSANSRPSSAFTVNLHRELKGPAESHQSHVCCQVRRNTFTHLQSDSSQLAANPVSLLTPAGDSSREDPTEAGAFC